MNGRNDRVTAHAKPCLLRRPWALLSNLEVSGIGRVYNRKFSVLIKAGHGPSHSTDFNWPRLLPPTRPSQSGVSYIERWSMIEPGLSLPGVQRSTN